VCVCVSCVSFSFVCLYVCLAICFNFCRSVLKPVFLYLCVCVCLSVCFSVCLSDCLSVGSSLSLSVCLFMCVYLCMSVRPSACLFVCLSAFLLTICVEYFGNDISRFCIVLNSLVAFNTEKFHHAFSKMRLFFRIYSSFMDENAYKL